MKRTQAQWDKLYSNYVKKWNQYNKELPAGMADKMYTQLEHRNAYVLLERMREEQVAKGTRKVLNVQRDLINAQKYQYTLDQTRAVKQALIKKEIQKIKNIDKLTNKEYKKEVAKISKQFKIRELRQRVDAADEIYQLAKDLNKELKGEKVIDSNGNEVYLYDSKARAKIIASVIFGS